MRKRIIAGLAGLMLSLFVGQFFGGGVDEAGAAQVKKPNRRCPICHSCGGDSEYYCHADS